ncbi:MAG: hypothetical protein WAW13_03000 [Minisyncoccia bacterium]
MTFLVNKSARGRASSVAVPNFKLQIFWGVLRLVLIAFCGVLVWYVTRLEFFTIASVEVSGGETISHEEIRIRMLDELKGAYFLIIPKRFTYLYPHDRMIEVLEKNQRMHSVVVERTERTTLSVSFMEYIPYALWCSAESSSTPCYFLTSDGYAFTEAPELIGGTLVRHSVEGIEEIKEGTVIDVKELRAIDTFIERAKNELGFRITSLVHTKDKDIQFLINGGGSILVSKGKDLTVTFDNVKSVLESKEFKHIKPGNFNYIDARFNNKIFVKEAMDSVGTTTEEVLDLPE